MRGPAFERRIRRNRWRMAAVTLVASLNLWVMLTLLLAWIIAAVANGSASPAAVFLGAGAGATAIAVTATAFLLGTATTYQLRATNAVPATEPEHERFAHILDELAIGFGIPAPHAAIVDDPSPNAFAVGRKPASTTVAVTTGLLDTLNRAELEAVVAVVLSSVALRDVALGTVASACTAQTAWFGGVLEGTRFILITGPAAALAGKLRDITRHDHTSSAEVFALDVTRHPAALMSAYQKLRDHHRRLRHTGDIDLWLVGSVLLTDRMRTIEELYGVPVPTASA